MLTSYIQIGCLLIISCTVVTSAIIPQDRTSQVDQHNICQTDFVEKFFRLLSGPVGKEAEALVAAVLKLLSENDRVYMKALIAKDDDVISQDVIKRLQPKFNPTGWRRKRDATQSDQWNRFIHSLYDTLDNDKSHNEIPTTSSWPKRSPWNSGERRYPYFGGAFKLKRKPLKFNPTGW